MKILFDHCTPKPLKQFLKGHNVTTADQQGWERLENGDLLDAADEHRFDIFITTDNKMEHQQNFRKRTFGTVFITKPDWPRIKAHIPDERQKRENRAPEAAVGRCASGGVPTRPPSPRTDRKDAAGVPVDGLVRSMAGRRAARARHG